jgi:hypothetical protein
VYVGRPSELPESERKAAAAAEARSQWSPLGQRNRRAMAKILAMRLLAPKS